MPPCSFPFSMKIWFASFTAASTPATIAAASLRVGAFGLQAGSKDAALLITLQPGAYTVQVTGVGNTTGIALVLGSSVVVLPAQACVQSRGYVDPVRMERRRDLRVHVLVEVETDWLRHGLAPGACLEGGTDYSA